MHAQDLNPKTFKTLCSVFSVNVSGTFLETECANSIGEDQEVCVYSSARQAMHCVCFKGRVLGKDGERGCCQLQGRRGRCAGGLQRSQELQTLAEQSRFSLTTVRVCGGGSVVLTHGAKN